MLNTHINPQIIGKLLQIACRQHQDLLQIATPWTHLLKKEAYEPIGMYTIKVSMPHQITDKFDIQTNNL